MIMATTAPTTQHETESPTATTHASTEEASSGGIAGVIGTFGLRTDLFIAQLVNFLLVLLVLWKFAYKPILRALHEREDKIAQSVKNAEAIGQKLAQAQKEKEDILRAARQEADAFTTKALTDTEIRKVEMVEAAKKEVERVIAKGKEQLDAERQAMMMAMRKDVVEIAVAAATKIVASQIDEKKSTSMAEEVVRKMT